MRRFACLPLMLCAAASAQEGGAVRLRVQDHNGGPVIACKVTVLRVFPQRPEVFARLPEFADRQLAAADFDGDVATLRGLPAGNYVLQVAAEQLAMARSAPFAIGGDGAAPEVSVRLTRGAVLQGVVTGPDGKPLQGVEVRTEPPTPLGASNELAKVFSQFLAETVTRATATTDADGRFQLPRLIAGSYRVVASHPDFCAARVAVAVETDQRQTVEGLRLARGAAVEGTVTLAGAAAAGARVTVGLQPAPGEPPTPGALMDAIADAQGRFRFAQRLPPGRYVLSASRVVEGQNNPFAVLLQIKATQRELVVEEGQDKLTQDFAIPKQ